MAKREFTDDEIAGHLAALRANGGNAKKTAKERGVSRTTLRGWAGRHANKTGTSKHVPEPMVDAKAQRMADRFDVITEKITQRVIDNIGSVRVETATDIRNLLIGGGITTEKASFARGGPTSRTESLKVSLVAPEALRSGTLKVIQGGKRTIPARKAESA